MTTQQTVKATQFKTIRKFENYCYHECPIGKDPVQKIGCILRCELRTELRKLHPEWFGKKKEVQPKKIDAVEAMDRQEHEEFLDEYYPREEAK